MTTRDIERKYDRNIQEHYASELTALFHKRDAMLREIGVDALSASWEQWRAATARIGPARDALALKFFGLTRFRASENDAWCATEDRRKSPPRMIVREPVEIIEGEKQAREAENRLLSLAESATDEEVSEAAADWLLTRFSAPAPYCLTVPHAIYDKRSTALHAGHPLLAVDYYGKSWIGLSTRDRDRARRWIICAMMLDYTVTICVDRRDRDGYTPGSVSSIRRNAAQRRRIFERA